MSTETSDNTNFVETIDLRSRTQKKKRDKKFGELREPDPPLDEVEAEDLSHHVEQVFRARGWEDLMPVQKKAIPYLLDKQDLIVQSRTGSGKTGAFLLPLFDLVDPNRTEAQVLILTPTRELARQIHEEFERMKIATPKTNELDTALLYGGVGYGPQISALKNGAQIVVGTPGRTLDHLKKGNFEAGNVGIFILDEADEMLSMGFFPDMKEIESYLLEDRQSYMFSATMPPKVRVASREFLDDPGFLSLSADQVSVDAIEHRYYLVPPMEKDEALTRIIDAEEPESAIIFCNTKREVSYLAQSLQNAGYNADEISGDLSQRNREKVMDEVRNDNVRFLVATDVAARGIDISDLDFVFMYDVPQDREYYIHRSGRTARAGKKGTSVVLATHEDEYQLIRTASRYGIDLQRHELPETQEDLETKAYDELSEQYRLRSTEEREEIDRYTDFVQRVATEEPALLAQFVQRAMDEAAESDDD